MLVFMAMGSLSVWAESMPMDTRLQQLHTERSQHGAQPLPANVSFADVIGNDFDAFHNENDTHKEGTHAFFIKLGDKTALALGFEKGIDGKGPTEIRYKGQPVKLGPLLRKPPNTERSMMWVWEAELPPGAVPLVRERLPLPLILWKDEMTVLTSKGPKQGTLTDRYFRGPYLPGHAVDGGSSMEMDDGDAYEAVRIGDPIIETSTGIVVGAVRNKIPESKSINSPADCGIVWLSFPRPPEELTAPLAEVWGAAVPSHPSLDKDMVQSFMPARVFSTKIGEKIEDVWERNPLLHRLPPEAKDRWPSVDEFGREWMFSQQSIDTEEGRVASIHFGGSASIGSKTTLTFIQWLAEKFQHPKVLLKTPKGNELLAIWNRESTWIAAGFDLSDKTMTASLFVAGKEAQIKERYRLERFSVTAAADKSTFVSMATAMASQAQKEDFGVTKDLVLSNPVIAAGSSQTVMKRNGEDIPMEAPAKPVTAQKAEEPRQDSPAGPAPSVNKAELRALAVQRIETLGRVVQAYNAMPEKLRQEARVQSVAGAFGLLRKHADRYPELPLNDDLRDTMEWALVLLDTGSLLGSPALQKLAQVTNGEIAIANAQRTAEHLATTFQAAKAAGTRAFDQVKTLDDIIPLLNAGVKGTGTSKSKVFTSKNTPELAAEARQHLKFDAKSKTLRYIPKSVKLEGSPVPLEGIEELALLIKQTPEAPQAAPVAGSASQTPDAEVRQAALALCNEFNAAMATGMTELDDVKTVDEIILRFKQGVQSGSQIHFLRSTLEHTQAAKPYVQLDLKKKLLLLSPGGMNAGMTGPMARQANPSLNYPGSPAEAERKAHAIAIAFQAAKATGSKQLDDAKTVDEIINRLNVGVNGGGNFAKKRFYVRTTPSQAAAAKPFLRFDGTHKALFYHPGSMDAQFYYPKSPEAQTRTLASGNSEAKAQRIAQTLATIYAAAEATGSKEIDQLQSIDAVIQRITTTGLIGGPGPFEGKRFSIKTQPGENEAAKAYLRYDSFTKTLSYSATPIGGSRSSNTAQSANETRPTLIHSGSEATRVSSNVSRASGVPANSEERLAAFFATAFNAAVTTGSEELDDVRSVDAAMSRMVAGVYGGGVFKEKRFIVKATPAEVAAARRYLTFNPAEKNLRFTSMGGSTGSSTAPAANETRPTVMNVGRAVGGGVTFGGRTFANVAEMEKAIRESHEAAKQALATRNAQAFVSTYNAAMAAGAKELDNVSSVDQALKRIMAGVNGGGPFKDRLFVVDATPEEAAGVRPYIEFDPSQGTLIYKSPYR